MLGLPRKVVTPSAQPSTLSVNQTLEEIATQDTSALAFVINHIVGHSYHTGGFIE